MKEKIIRALLRAPKRTLDIWQLSRKCGYLLDVIKTSEALSKEGMVKLGNSKVSFVGRGNFPDYLLKKDPLIRKVMRKYLKYRKGIIFENEDFDQLSVLPDGIERKLLLMMDRNDLLNKDILCIGDDDLFSIACSLTGLPRSITVFDIDDKVVSFINKASKDIPVPVKTVKLNLLKGLPEKYKEASDVFICEPPDTVKGTLLFVSRGIQALRKRGCFYLGMTEETLSKKQWLEIQKAVLDSGIFFTDIVRDCEEYTLEGYSELEWKGFERLPKWVDAPAKDPWFVSTLFRGEIAGKKKKINISFKDVEKELITSLLPEK